MIRSATVAAALLALVSCVPKPPAKARFIDLEFPVPRSGAQAYPHAIDGSGTLWYLDGASVVRQPSPGDRRSVRDAAAKDGRILWYDGSIVVLDGDGAALERFDPKMRSSRIAVPRKYVPLVGAIADERHRAIVAAQSSPHDVAVVDVWRWYRDRLPKSIEPFAASVAGGPHGKHYLVAGDRHRPLVAIENRWTGHSIVVGVNDNRCFSGKAALDLPLDVRGRDGNRVWVTSGTRVVSIELSTKKTLRVWDLPGCSVQIVTADEDSATVIVAKTTDYGYESSLAHVAMDGVRPMPQYGTISTLASGASIDGFRRLWWFDPVKSAFICRTPLS